MGRTTKRKAGTKPRAAATTKRRTVTATIPTVKTAKQDGAGTAPPAKTRWAWWLIPALAAAPLLCYANTLANGFVFDDHDLVLGNKLLRSLTNFPQLVLSSYRPVRDLSYTLDFAIWGERPLGFHLTNILLHSANTVLAFFLAFRITRRRIVCAAIAAAVFALHPIQTDAVAYISGRRDLLFTTFYLLSFMSYLRYREEKAALYFILFIASWVGSLLSKEMAASLPLVIYVWNFCDAWRGETGPWAKRVISTLREAFRRDRWLYLGLAGLALGYTALMVFVRRASVRAGQGGFDYWGGSFYYTMLTVARVHLWYLKQLVYPTPIAQYFGVFDVSRSILDLRVVLSLAAIMVAVSLAFAQLSRDRLMSFAMLSYFVMLLPVSQFIPHHELVADHYLYLPIVSFGLLVSLVADRASREGPRARLLALGLCAVVIIGFGVLTVIRNGAWKDDLAVWQANYEAVPTSPRAAFNLAVHNLGRNPRRSEELFKRSLELDPTYAPTYTSLSQLYLSQNRLAECEALVRGGLELPDEKIRSFITRDPRKFRSQLTTALAVVKGKQGDQAKGEELLWRAIEIYSANMEPYAALAAIFHGKDRAKEIDILERAAAANPFAYEVVHRLTFVLVEDRMYDRAVPHLEQMLQLVPSDFYANYQLGQIYRTKSDCSRSAGYLQSARLAASNSEESSLVNDAVLRLEQQCGNR